MIEQVNNFLDLLYELDRETHRLVNLAILVLEQNGPGQGRPLVDSVTAYLEERKKEVDDERNQALA